MGKVLWHCTMSLDGFIAGRNDAMDWIFERFGEASANASSGSRLNAMVAEIVQATGAVLAGRRSYEVGKANGPGVYGGAWSGPQFVLTHRPPEPSADLKVRFLSSGIADAVAQARDAAKGKNVLLIGASIAGQCIEEGLVDEVLVHIAPILLGDGVRLFAREGARRVHLEKTFSDESGPITTLRFRVVHPL